MPHDDHSHSLLPSDPALRVKALETLLVEKGLVDPAALDEIIDTYSHKIGPKNGAKVVAKAWVDSDFRAALFSDATSAVRDLGYYGRQGEHWSRWKIRQPRITWSSAHCAVVTHGHCWAFRQVGTNLMPIARVRCVNPAQYCRNLEQP